MSGIPVSNSAKRTGYHVWADWIFQVKKFLECKIIYVPITDKKNSIFLLEFHMALVAVSTPVPPLLTWPSHNPSKFRLKNTQPSMKISLGKPIQIRSNSTLANYSIHVVVFCNPKPKIRQ